MVKKIIYILPFLFLMSCVKNDWKTWTIKKGKFYPTGAFLYTYSSNNLDFLFEFDSTAIYEIPNSQINKLYGLCPGYNALHESYRIGWKYYRGDMQMWAYIHDEGTTIKQYLGNVEINTVNTAGIHLVDSGAFYQLNGNTTFCKFNTNIKNTYFILSPYFGGETPAPHDITIKIKQQPQN